MQETGNDPITQEPLDLDDLISVKTNKAVKPRPAPATSIPGLLGLFHNVRLQLANAGHAKQAYCTARLPSGTFQPPVFSAHKPPHPAVDCQQCLVQEAHHAVCL